MIWSFLAVFFSGWLYVDASYRGPQWQRWVFKPVTLLLLFALAWQAPVLENMNYLILAGLLAAMLGDALSLLSGRRTLYAIGAFFLSYLLYTIHMLSAATPGFSWAIPVVLLTAGAALLVIIWPELQELRWPICALVAITLVMSWLAIDHYMFMPGARNLSLMAGAILLLLANSIKLISRYRCRFKADSAVIAAGYFLGHFMIVRSLWLI